MNNQLAPSRGRHAAPEPPEFDLREAPTAPLFLPFATVPRPATSELPTRRPAGGASSKRRVTFAAASVAVLTAATGGAYLLGAHTSVATSSASRPAVSAVPVPAPAPAVSVTPVAAPARAAAASTHTKRTNTAAKSTVRATTTHRASTHRTSSDTGAGCGQRAVTAGVFNPACSEFQGYLDPGVSAGRAPNDADIQNAWTNCTATKTDAECRRELS